MKMIVRNSWMLIALSLVGGEISAAGEPSVVADADAPPVTLMGTLSEWLYPGSKPRGGATMSDGGNPHIASVKCHAVLTTPESVAKVFDFYTAKFEKPQRLEDGTPAVSPADARSVTTLNDSDSRPVELRVIVVHKATTSTTLVISRAKGENSTHIAWTHYMILRSK